MFFGLFLLIPRPRVTIGDPKGGKKGKWLKVVRFKKFFFLSGRELNSMKGGAKKSNLLPFWGAGCPQKAQNGPFASPSPQKGGGANFKISPFLEFNSLPDRKKNFLNRTTFSHFPFFPPLGSPMVTRGRGINRNRPKNIF